MINGNYKILSLICTLRITEIVNIISKEKLLKTLFRRIHKQMEKLEFEYLSLNIAINLSTLIKSNSLRLSANSLVPGHPKSLYNF